MSWLLVAGGLASALFTLSPQDPFDERSAPEPEGVTFQGANGATIRETDGVITLLERQGWVRSRHVYTDFELTFEYRPLTPGAQPAVAVRAQRVDSGRLEGQAFHLSSSTSGGWRRVTVRSEATRVTLTVDDSSSSLDDTRRFAGFILLRATDGDAEFRNLSLVRIFRAWQPPGGILTGKQLKARNGTPPQLIREVKPRYTRRTMSALIQGEVHMDAVVLADGSVGDVHVFRSLHPDLDEEAAATVKRWKFRPAMLDGAAVPTLVEIQMTFALR
jgi:TonB family protein